MVERRQIATLFKIERKGEDMEQLIPFAVVEGVYDRENYTFTTLDGTVYLHIEETEFPNFGYAHKTLAHHCQEAPSDDIDNIECAKENILKSEQQYKYMRFIGERDKIYQKSPEEPTVRIMTDLCSRKYKETMAKLKEEATEETYGKIDLTPLEMTKKVKETIKGQDSAIETIATCLWATLKNRKLTKKQMLLIGPTGVGKTAIFEKI